MAFIISTPPVPPTSMLFILVLIFIVSFLFLRFSGTHRSKDSRITSFIILGSGGHTSEMFRLLEHLPKQKYGPRIYVIANTDKNSLAKVESYEESTTSLNQGSAKDPVRDYRIEIVPRSREVKQSFLTSVWTTAYATFFSLRILLNHCPDLLICNGPGTCVPFCLLVALLRPFTRLKTKMIYVESFARVTNLSLTGKILYSLRVVDVFLVQWPQLTKRYPKATYVGRLV